MAAIGHQACWMKNIDLMCKSHRGKRLVNQLLLFTTAI